MDRKEVGGGKSKMRPFLLDSDSDLCILCHCIVVQHCINAIIRPNYSSPIYVVQVEQILNKIKKFMKDGYK